MIKKVDTFESIRINNVKIDMEELVGILEATGELLISLECGDTIYESLDEIKSHKSAISIPFTIECGETSIKFGHYDVAIYGRSSSSHRQKALSKELEAYVPITSKKPFVTLIAAWALISFGLPRIFEDFSVDGSPQIFGSNLEVILLLVAMTTAMIAAMYLYTYHWSRTKIYSSRYGFWVRHKEQIAVGVIVSAIVAVFSYFIGFAAPD